MTQEKFDYRSYDRASDKVMTPEQFTQVIEAIAVGKYSWACVLILRFAGYNPLHYIPYRTYNRLDKENNPGKRNRAQDKPEAPRFEDETCDSNPSKKLIQSQISDLAYLEMLEETSNIRGGYHQDWLEVKSTNFMFRNDSKRMNFSRLLTLREHSENRLKMIGNLIQ